MTERGRSMKGIGITLIVLAVITGLILHFVPAEDVAYFGWWGTPSIAILGAYVFYRGKQYVARGEAQTYSQKDLPHTQVWSDDRPPVVYLRSFSQDEAMASQVLTAPLNVQ